jgi:hypothetical protein
MSGTSRTIAGVGQLAMEAAAPINQAHVDAPEVALDAEHGPVRARPAAARQGTGT